MAKYKVSIDNGASYCGELPEEFDTEEEAETAGADWLAQFYADNDVTDRDNDPAGYDVHEVGES